MASLFVPVRIATLVLTGISLILAIVNLIQVIDNSKDATAITSLTIVIVVLFIGAYGSFKNERNYLITFALILIIATIVGFVGKAAIYTSLGFNIVLIILALTQSEMLRRGF